MPIFGYQNTFAISCKLPEYINPNEQVLILCHYLVAGDFIGNEDEPDLLGTCAGDLKRALVKLCDLQAAGHETIFDGLNDLEALAIVRKANQLEEEFEPNFLYLPQQPETFWYAHQLWLAESTDKAQVIVFNYAGRLKIIKQPYWDEPKEVKSVLSKFELATQAFTDCLQYLKSSYPDRLTWLQL